MSAVVGLSEACLHQTERHNSFPPFPHLLLNYYGWHFFFQNYYELRRHQSHSTVRPLFTTIRGYIKKIIHGRNLVVKPSDCKATRKIL